VEVNLTEAGKQAVLQHTGLDVHQLGAQLERLSQNELQQIEQGLALLLKAVGGDFDC